MSKVVKLQLGEYRPVYFYDLNAVECERGDYVIMEVERGSEFGKVQSNGFQSKKPNALRFHIWVGTRLG